MAERYADTAREFDLLVFLARHADRPFTRLQLLEGIWGITYEGYDRIVTRGPEGEAVSFWYYQGETLLAVDAMNDPRAYMVGKRLLEMVRSPDPAVIADPATPLKTLLQ